MGLGHRQNAHGALRVCFVCNELPPAPSGGIGYCVLTVAKGLAAQGHSVTVVGCYAREHEWRLPDVRVERVPACAPTKVRLDRLVDMARLRSRLVQLHRGHGLDIVEWPDYQGLYLRGIPRVVDVVHNHGPAASHFRAGLSSTHWLTRMMEVRTLRRVPNWIGTSRWFMEQWLQATRARPRRAEVIYNPVDCQLFRPGPENDRDEGLVMYAGTLSDRKGAFALARAARMFLRELPSARLLYVGRDPDGLRSQRLRDLAGAAVSDRVHFQGPVPQTALAVLMRRCAVFAMPSILESFGNVWAEAMASGTPVVGSTLSCGPEIVPDGEAGILADPHAPDTISDAVIRLMRSRDLRLHLGQAGRKAAVEHYSLDAVIPATEQFYRGCLETRTDS